PSHAVRSDRRRTPLGRLGGPKPSKCHPNPATCAAGSEALRSKVSLRVSPAAPRAQWKRVLSEKAGSAGLFRQTKDRRQGFVDGPNGRPCRPFFQGLRRTPVSGRASGCCFRVAAAAALQPQTELLMDIAG